MNQDKYLISLGLIAITLSPSLMGFSSLPNNLSRPSNDRQISLNFPPTGDRKAPKTTAGGGTRSDDIACISAKEGDIPLVALMPNRENIGKTATPTPTFYWYVPKTQAKSGEFVMTDQQGNEVYYTNFALPNQPGIIKLTVPQKANLQPDQTYSWSFMVVCDPQYRNRDKFVEGKIQYIAEDNNLQNQLKQLPDLEKAELLAQKSIWFDTLDVMAKIHAEKTTEWQQLLQSVGLEDLANQPFIPCCQAQP
ncbi:DUF928 domain-containing protein [Gloeothece verrucosa]|uniref:DUF928 domain-containing protein n=1 Tax=Gloeothece verrucosa (strain PCC 7822) TaxID=497965 RepID=E0UIN5_GLOV7|nr:DUF928 domain-containing protein [Gloeothece verrucosa]ADN12229.1 protein of unknown function DUF928 [Gloeothece verrucosa PCC 7822]